MSMIAVGLGVTAAVGIGSAISAADTARKQLHAGQDALAQQKDLAASLKYEPIDLTKLAADAATQATANATASLGLERSLQPDVARTREGIATSVADELARGGNLSPDVANQVATAARTRGAASGAGGNSAPLTAALTGQTAQSLLQQRQSNAMGLVAANPLPVAGLDPGALASAEVAQNAAQNQFNMAKAGVSSNLINSGAQLQATQAGVAGGNMTNMLNLVSQLAAMSPAVYKSLNTPNSAGGTTMANPNIQLAGGSTTLPTGWNAGGSGTR